MKKKTTIGTATASAKTKTLRARKPPKTTASATSKTESPAPLPTHAAPELKPLPPSVMDELVEPAIIEFMGTDGKVTEVFSSLSGSWPVSKRLAVAYPQSTLGKSNGTVTGVACDPRKAFDVLKFDPDPLAPYILARLKTDVPTMTHSDLGTHSIDFGTNISVTATSRRTGLRPPPRPAPDLYDTLTSRHRLVDGIA